MIGTISRWGSRGYGFVIADDSTVEAWLHLKFVEDPGYEPRQGDRVEFVLEKLPDGRYQAKRVRRAGSSLASVMARPRPANDLPRPIAASTNGAASSPRTPMFTGGGALQAALLRAEVVTRPAQAVPRAMTSSSPRPSANEDAPGHGASSAPLFAVTDAPPVAGPTERLDLLLQADRSRRTGELAGLREELATVEAQLVELEARRVELDQKIAERDAGALEVEAALVSNHVLRLCESLEVGLVAERRVHGTFEVSRMAAITAFGLPPVEHYLQLRGRLREAQDKGDTLAESAFRMLERERRQILRDLAEALDRVDAAPPLRAGSLGSDGAARGPLDPRTPMACAFFHLAERAARELAGVDGSTPATATHEAAGRLEYGVVGGCVAVRFAAPEAALLELLLDETWSGRPSLESSGIEPELEVVVGAAPVWAPEAEPDPGEEELAAAGGASRAGMTLPDAAARLGLSLRDLVAMLYDRGLPFPDDSIDAGTEETLRALLGDTTTDEEDRAPASPAVAVPDSPPGAARDDPPSAEAPPESGQVVAARMLRKLLRDRRVGGRHTRIENAYGHHFSDGEKLMARRVAEWLEKVGIFIPKLNEGSHHISINPRRLREVGQIIDGTWADKDAFDQL